MKTRKLRKVLLTLCSALLLVSLSVGVTVAYLTSETDVVKNTFTVGQVNITLDECKSEYNPATNAYVDTNERTATGADVTQNYKLMPGIEIAKDPTVTVVDGSEDCFVRAFVTISYKDAAEKILPENVFTTWINGYDEKIWVPYADGYSVTKENGVTSRTYELRYAEEVEEPATLTDIFTGITLPDDLDNDDIALLDTLSISIVANAIQADGFTDAAAAWSEWE